jgi:hypothetical protein
MVLNSSCCLAIFAKRADLLGLVVTSLSWESSEKELGFVRGAIWIGDTVIILVYFIKEINMS